MHGLHEFKYSGGFTTNTNYIDIGSGSSVDGLTVNNGGESDSGAGVFYVSFPLHPLAFSRSNVIRSCPQSDDAPWHSLLLGVALCE